MRHVLLADRGVQFGEAKRRVPANTQFVDFHAKRMTIG